MNRIFVLKDVAYAAKVGGGTIASVKEVNLLAPGALAFFTPRGLLLTAGNAAANVPDVKEVMMASGRTSDNQLVGQVPRLLSAINRANYRAFVKPTTTVYIDGIGASDEGDMAIRVSDVSYTSRYNTRLLNTSYFKKSNVSVENAVEGLVAKLNLSTNYVTAVLTDTVGVPEQFTVQVTAAATAAGIATLDVDGNTINLPLTISNIATNTAEITAVLDALTGWSATDNGVDTVTVVADDSGLKTDVANFVVGGATTTAVTLVTTVQGVASLGTYTIDITPKEEGVAIELSLTGLIEGNVIATTVTPVYGIGRGEDVLQMEKDFSVEEGNGNYIEYTAEWYKRNMEADTAVQYDLITSLWEGQHSSPTRSHNVMKNRTVIACVNGAGGGQLAATILVLMALIFGNAYSATTGVITSADDGTDYDGVPGN